MFIFSHFLQEMQGGLSVSLTDDKYVLIMNGKKTSCNSDGGILRGKITRFKFSLHSKIIRKLFNVYYVFYSQFPHQHVSAAIVVIFRVKIAAIGAENCAKILNKIHHKH